MVSIDMKIPKTVKIFGLLLGISVITMGLTLDYFDEAFAVSKKENRNQQCAQDQVVVLRFTHNDYLCVDQGTASRWVSLDMAEIVRGNEITSREQCKGGFVYMNHPYTDDSICVKRGSVQKLISMGWIAQDFEPGPVATRAPTASCKSGEVVFQKTDADKSDRTGGIAGDIICIKQVDAYKFEGSVSYERISEVPDYDVETPECNDRYVMMINDDTDEEFCIRVDKIRQAMGYGFVEVGESRINSGAGSTDCKGGMVKMLNPNSGVMICEKQSDVPKRTALGWQAQDFTPAATVTTPSPTASCKGGEAVLQCVNCQASDRTAIAGDIICSKQTDVGKFTSKGWVRIDKQEKQIVEGTIQSEQDGGRNHESHQIALLLAPENTVKVGVVTYTASEPVQLVVLHGPLGPGDDGGQPIWTPDGKTNFALTLVEGKSSGTFEFAGNALALHTMSAAPFQATYTISYHSLPAGEYSEGVVDYGTMKSGIDPGIGHESHSLTILLAPSETPYHDGVLSYAASEPVQMVVLHGPLGPGEDIGQPTWSPDGETKFGLTFVDDNMASGSFEFTGNAVAAHTMNTDGFTISYSLATRR